MKRNNKIGSIFIISAVSIVGVFFLILGLIAFNTNMYPYDIYLSQPITLSVAEGIDNQYLISGEITNKGEESITIQKLVFRCYNADSSVHGTHEIDNVTILPGDKYSIHEEIVSNGSVTYTYARLYQTIVEDSEIILKYSEDGENFSNKQNEVTLIIVGRIMLVIAGFMIFRRIQFKRRNENG